MNTPLIDKTVFAEFSEAMGSDFATELVNTFLDDAPNMFAALKEAAKTGDADGVRRAAHSIKSNAEIFGAMTLASAAREIELGGLPNGADPIPALEATYADTATALRSMTHE